MIRDIDFVGGNTFDAEFEASESTFNSDFGEAFSIGLPGADGIYVIKAEINENGELVLYYSNGTSTNLGKVVGSDGTNGSDGVGIQTVKIDENGNLVVTLTNGTVLNLGNVKGADGKDGEDGEDGKDGENGKDGVSVTKSEINADSELVLTFSDGKTVNVGKVVGADGKDGQDGTNGSDGKDGKDGVDGVTPTIEISADGYWVINGIKTWNKATGEDGKNGTDGNDYILTDTDKKDIADLIDDKGYLTQHQLTDAEANYIKKMFKDANYEKFTGSLSMSPTTTTYEMGASTEVAFSWSFNKVPTSVVFNNVSQPLATSGSAKFNVTRSSHGTVMYSLTAKYKDEDPDFAEETVTASKSISFYNKYYWGCKPIPAEINSNFIKGLGNSGWATTKARDFTPTCTADQYIWYAYPARLNPATMYAGGFEGGFEPALTVSVTNGSGITEDYYVYRSTNAGVSLSIQAK